MPVQGSGEVGVKELAGKICIGLFIWEIIDMVVSIDGDIDTVDTGGGMRKVVQLSGCKGYSRKGFLLSKGGFWFHWKDRLGGWFDNRKSVSDG